MCQCFCKLIALLSTMNQGDCLPFQMSFHVNFRQFFHILIFRPPCWKCFSLTLSDFCVVLHGSALNLVVMRCQLLTANEILTIRCHNPVKQTQLLFLILVCSLSDHLIRYITSFLDIQKNADLLLIVCTSNRKSCNSSLIITGVCTSIRLFPNFNLPRYKSFICMKKSCSISSFSAFIFRLFDNLASKRVLS